MNNPYPKSEAEWEKLRRMSPAQRLEIANRLTNEALAREWTEVRERYPDVSEKEFRLLLIEHRYGAELAQRVREHLEKHPHEF